MEVAPASPINILLEEHKMIQQIAEKLGTLAEKCRKAESLNAVKAELEELRHIADELLDAEKHCLRGEDALFPVLERHGISEPPAIMWMEHNQLRGEKKQLKALIENTAKMTFRILGGSLAN